MKTFTFEQARSAARLDRSTFMKSAHEAAILKKLLDARILAANDPTTQWVDHDQVFAEIEGRYAD